MSKPLVVKEEWVREWFEKIKKEKGEYVHGNTLDGYFSLDELAEFLTKKLKDSQKEVNNAR